MYVNAEARALHPSPDGLRDAAIVQVTLRDCRAVQAHLLELWPNLEAGVVAAHEERRDALRAGPRPGRCHHDVEARLAGIGDEDLAAVQEVAMAAPSRRGLQVREIGRASCRER